jgi:hypothetical protein
MGPGLASESDSTIYEAMTDEEVAMRACTALRKTAALPLGGAQRSVQWAVFDGAIAELERRAARNAVARLRDERGRLACCPSKEVRLGAVWRVSGTAGGMTPPVLR